MSSTAPKTTSSGHIPGTRRPRPPAAPTPPVTPQARARRALRTARAAARHAAPALAAYVAVRLTGLAVLAFWAPRRHQDLWVNLAAQWDSDWYLGIAEHGYTDELGTTPNTNNLAFFPLYPVLVKAVAVLTPGSRASTGLGLAVVASLIAAWGIFAVGDRLHGRRVGVLLTTLWAAFPVGAVQWMGYTESLFTACAAWALYAVLTGRWLWAAGCASLAGLTRPTGVAVAAAVTPAARPAPVPRLPAPPGAGADHGGAGLDVLRGVHAADLVGGTLINRRSRHHPTATAREAPRTSAATARLPPSHRSHRKPHPVASSTASRTAPTAAGAMTS
ncbi:MULTISPECIES: hypothetical protein [Streptomyces rochei group]|uniref:hypothetical protein n=1 Tax=Streptomyces rochei group TaxID=2867164 RepID=UPI003571415C